MKRISPNTCRSFAKKSLQSLACSLALSTLFVALASAQEFQIDGLSAVHTGQGRPILPPAPMFTNCKIGCVNYDFAEGYLMENPGQALAVQFTASGAPITKVIEANSLYSGSQGSTIGAVLLADAGGVPGAPISGGILIQVGSIPTWPSSAPITYKAKRPLQIPRGTKLWLCQWEPYPNTTGVWMKNDENDHGPFFRNWANTCHPSAGEWENGTGAVRPAFEIN
jgi:hypothetical protein